ncbi:MAG: redoxin domain-containing protein [Candidatus Tectomicrobia bacterium]|nr:redoxin domain-containing protein [Candidatus Tectomicrobia bacterium]
MVGLREASSLFQQQQVRLLGVVGERLARLQAHVAKSPLPFRLLADADGSTLKTYGVFHKDGLAGRKVAYPAVFLLDGEGIIRLISVGSTPRERPPVKLLLQAVAMLTPAA